MGFFGRLFGGDDRPPPWASFFPSAAAYRDFHQAVQAELARRGLAGTVDDGYAEIVSAAGPTRLGLQNLAQICNAIPRADWPVAIPEHFDNTLRSHRESQDNDARAEDFEQVRDILKVRLYPADHPAMRADSAVFRPVADDLVEVLTFDLPSSVSTVGRGLVARWSRPLDDLFALGRQNVRAEGKLKVERVQVEGAVTLTMLNGDSFFAASHALFLDEYPGTTTAHGAVVAVPTRHTIVSHAIEDLRAVGAIKGLIPVAQGFAKDGPGTISASLYWWRAGTFVRLPAEVTDQKVTFRPPDEFVDLLNQLPPPADN